MKKILVPLDLSSASKKTVAISCSMAKELKAKLWLLHIVNFNLGYAGYEGNPFVMRTALEKQFEEESRKLEQIARECRGQGIEVVSLIEEGDTAGVVLLQAKKLAVDMIIMGSHGHGAVYSMLVGSTCEGVMRESTCPVLIVPSKE